MNATRRWARRAAIFVGALLLLWALAWLAVPPLLKSQLQTRLGEMLGRSVTVGKVDFKPWSLELTIDDLAIGGPPGSAQPLLQLARVHADADAASLWRLAPVIDALELDGLQLHVARTAAGHYDIDDLLARFANAPAPAPEPADAKPARFALHNLQLRDATLVFDDRPAGRVHKVEQLRLGLPFLSTLPSQVDIAVDPHLSFRLNGAAFDSDAQATPFAAQRRGELKLAFKDLDLAPYLGYLPEALPVRLQRGLLRADLALRFAAPKDGPPSVDLSGSAGAAQLAVADRAGAPLLTWKDLQLGLKSVQPLARKLDFGTLRLQGAELDLARSADGRLNLAALAAGPAASAPPAVTPASASASAAAGAGWQLGLERFELADARVRWADAGTRPAAALQLDGIALQARALRWPLPDKFPATLSATLRAAAADAAPAGTLSVDGQFGEHEAQASVKLEGLSLPALAPYVAKALAPQLEGSVSLQGQLDWSDAAAAPRLALQAGQLSLDGLRLVEGSGRAARELAALKQLLVADASVDLQARRASVGRVQLAQPQLDVARDGEGRWNAQRWAVAAPAPAQPPAAHAPAPAPAASAAPAWQLQLKELGIEGGRLRYADAFAPGHAIETPVRLEVQALKLHVQDLAWPGAKGTAAARVQFAAKVGAPAVPREPPVAPGSLEWSGRLAPEPIAASGKVRIDRFPVQLFEPYFGEQIRLSLLRADAGLTGDFTVQETPRGWAVKAGGDARVADVHVHTRPEAGTPAGFAATDELLSWQSLAVDGFRFAMQPGTRPQLEIREAALSDFFARLVVTEQGRFNLSGVAAAPAAASAPAGAASAPPPVAAAASATPASAAEPAIDIAVGGVRLANGRIDFNDHFVRPNYSADLTELNGRLGAFRSGTPEMATLELRGRAAGTALLDIRGALNPTAHPLALDIQAKATDLELAPLSPYAGKYAGYAIERGKLSMEVAYKIAPDGKLEARNQVILNQLTFGDKVDSPDATKLPVLLAVALLRDRNGVIDINLPVSGSINDPQFSVFGIVLKVIGNLLVKALTAPFALLAGGGSDDLSLVEFQPGTAHFAPAGATALDKVAKALTDRPSLKMTVTGASDPASEREAFQRAAVQARLLAERRRELLRSGAAQAEVDAVATLDEPTRARLLKEVYRSTDLKNKPRNALGFARDIPGPEMEALLATGIAVNTDVMRELALQRGLAVRDALIAKGLPSERLFLAAPKLRASGEDDAAWTPRVQLSLGTN